MNIIGMIPARLNSTRLPGKMLLHETGKPLIVHTWEQAKQAKRLTDLYVVTDSEAIQALVLKAGGDVLINAGDHKNGTDRIAGAYAQITTKRSSDIIVNIQGDEPEISPDTIDCVVDRLIEDRYADIATAVAKTTDWNLAKNRDRVKVVLDGQLRAMYFSRAAIPYHTMVGRYNYLIHHGIYAYTAHALWCFADHFPCDLERTESLEQLRALYLGLKITCTIVDQIPAGIDTLEDYDAFVQRYKNTIAKPVL